jgi:hypothetical protein
MPSGQFADDQIEEMLRRMGEGETLTSIASDPRMPSVPTMWRWEEKQDELGERITRAREQGYVSLAEKARDKAQSADDPQKGRLAFDADRWFLGKMCPKRFGDKIDVTSGGEKLQTEIDEATRAVRLAALAKQINLNRGADAPD